MAPKRCYGATMKLHDLPSNAADLSVLDAVQALRSDELSAVDLLDAQLERIRERNGGEPSFDGDEQSINAWARLYPQRAREQAAAADQRLRDDVDNAPTLCGIPWGAKDLFSVAELPVTASSRVLEGNVAQRSATVVEHLEARSMVLIGHTHTHEFAAGGSTDQVGNPWALTLSAGGSSGGSAAAIAAGMTPAALGTDTAGSVRIPASLCGISAIKPSFNRVPTAGVIPLAPTLDHVGSMARTVADCALLLNEMSQSPAASLPWMGWGDPALDLPVEADLSRRPLAGVRIAITQRNMSALVHDDVVDAVAAAREACERLGATVIELSVPVEMNKADYDTILMAEARSYHARYAAQEEQYRGSTRDFLAFGSPEIAVGQYLDSQHARVEVTDRWRSWFRGHGIDVLLEPTQAIPASKRGSGYDADQAVGGEDPMTLFTALWNFTGFPAVTVPTTLGARSELPMSVSLISGPGEEHHAVRVGLALQRYEFPPLSPSPVSSV